MDYYCSDCENLDCKCFKKFVQNVSKRDVPITSARTVILTNLYDLVGKMQYSIFSDKFINQILNVGKNGKTDKGDVVWINTDGITIDGLQEKVDQIKQTIIETFTADAASLAAVDAVLAPAAADTAVDAAAVAAALAPAALANYNKFITRIYEQLEKTTFLYGKPNDKILEYEEKFYSVYEDNPLYNHKDTAFACGIFSKDNDLYLCSSGLKNNVFNIFYALKSTPDIRLNYNHDENVVIAQSLIAVLKVFVYIQLYEIIKKPAASAATVATALQANPDGVINSNIYNIITDFNTILTRYDLFVHVPDEIKNDREVDLNELIEICCTKINGVYLKPKDYTKTLVANIKLDDDLTFFVNIDGITLHFIENIDYRDNYFAKQRNLKKITGQYIPFKRNINDSVSCFNGTECAEPKLFNWLITKEILKKNEPFNFSCFWHGPPNDDTMTMYVTKFSPDIRKKLFLLGYYSYLLKEKNRDTFQINLSYNPFYFNPVFNNIMVPCSGCQINYDDILNNKITDSSYSWDASSCKKDIPLSATLYSPPVSRSNTGEVVEGEFDYGRGGKKTNKSRQNKTKRIKKSKKSKTRKTKGKKRHNSRKLR